MQGGEQPLPYMNKSCNLSQDASTCRLRLVNQSRIIIHCRTHALLTANQLLLAELRLTFRERGGRCETNDSKHDTIATLTTQHSHYSQHYHNVFMRVTHLSAYRMCMCVCVCESECVCK